MAIRDKNDIRVYNECPFQVNLVGQKREYVFPPCLDGTPTMNFINFDEIEYAHSRYKNFRIGLLIFDESEQENMYDVLGMKDWKETVWFDKDIEDIILNPTLDKMQRVINIKDLITLERVRGKMVNFINNGKDVSQNVINIVNQRYREITSGNINSKIVIRSADVEKPVSSAEVDELKRQLADMQKLMEKMAASNMNNANATTANASNETGSRSTSTQTKRTGRRASTTKKF